MYKVVNFVVLDEFAVASFIKYVELLEAAREIEFLVHCIRSNYVIWAENLTQLAR